MKKALFTISLLGFFSANAQVVIQNVKPPLGTTYTMSSVSSAMTELSQGADQVWDLTSATTSLICGYTVLDPATLPAKIKDSVPTATFGTRLELGAPNPDLAPYDFFEDKTTYWLKVGVKGSGSGAVDKKHDTVMIFNQAYGSTMLYGNVYRKYAGYGTLKFKTKTYNNVVMFKVYLAAGGDTATQLFQFSPHYQQLLNYANMGGTIQNKLYWEPTGSSTGVNELSTQDMSLYPNPTKNNLQVSLPLEINGMIRVMDLQGKEYLHSTLNGKEVNLSLEPLNSGIYLLQLQTENQTLVKKFVVE